MVMVKASAKVVRAKSEVVDMVRGVAWPKKKKGHDHKPKGKKPAVVKTSEPEEGLTVGKTTKLQVHAYWGLLLGQQARAKLSDAQLEAAVRKEFPLREKVQPAARLRGWYNCGTYAAMGLAVNGARGTNGKRPPERCLRYENGVAVGRGAPKLEKTAKTKKVVKVKKASKK